MADKYQQIKNGERPSAAKLLFHSYFTCLVPNSEMMDENDFEYFGVATTGNEDWDRKIATAHVERMLSPAQMAELIAEGVPLTLHDPKDSIEIYKIIVEHLRDWETVLENRSVVFDSVPLEGLGEFNTLAAMLVPVGRGRGLIEGVSKRHRRASNSNRRYSKKWVKPVDLKGVQHSDALYKNIVTLAADLGYRVHKRNSAFDVEVNEKINHNKDPFGD